MASGIIPTEHQEQVAVCRWLRLRGELFFAVPNAGQRRGGQTMKREGMTAGVADLIIIRPGGGIALEMKRRKSAGGGRLSPVQRDWLATVDNVPGWRGIVAHGAQDAIEQLTSPKK